MGRLFFFNAAAGKKAVFCTFPRELDFAEMFLNNMGFILDSTKTISPSGVNKC